MRKDDKYWKSVFTLPHICIRDIKVKEFQHKILHRYYPCQSIVSKWDDETPNICCLCKNDIANLTHTFFYCQYVHTFWKQLENWIKNCT